MAAATGAWAALSRIIPSRNADCDYWWRLTGMQLASMMEAADYSVEKQYEALLFHYHYVVPYMGPSPTPELSFEWPCVLSLEGLPIEYSWKWNTATKPPEIRYTIEAKSKSSGSKTDPLNQDASREMLRCLRSSFPGVDLTWTDHFMAALFDHDRSKYTKAAAMASEAHTTSVMIAAELKPAGFAFKTYLIPRRVDERYPSLLFWQDAIAKLSPNNLAAGALYRFLNTSEGKQLSPTMLAVDNISPAQSRLKFYFQSPRTNFASTREILTLGGTISVSDAKIELLKTLIAAVVNLGPDFPENAELPIATDFSPPVEDADNNKTLALPGYGYYFDIAPNKKLPEVKLFIRTCVTGPDDYSLGSNLTEWMNTHGRGDYCQRYMSMIKGLALHRHLDRGKGVHTHVSCLIKDNGELDITSYLTPQILTQPSMMRRVA